MKVLHVIPGLPKRSSGTATFMQSLFKAQAKESVLDVEIATVEPVDPEISSEIPVQAFKHKALPIPSLGRSPELYRHIKEKSKSIDIIHSHGLWMLPNIYPEFARRGARTKLVMMPHGTLSPYAINRSWWKKQIMLRLGQREALEKADLIIATCSDEVQDIRGLGIKTPIAIIPVGVDSFPDHLISTKKNKTIVFLSRIDHKKGVEILLKTWKGLYTLYPDWELSIAGPLNGAYAQAMISFAKELQCERLSFVGELQGEEKIRFLSEASCFVLPTFSENFGIAIAEALMCGTPVITTKGAPWEGLIENEAGWWIEPNSEEALYTAITEAIEKSEVELVQMGQRGAEWMKRDFSWERVADMYTEVYEWLLGERGQPSFVYTK